MTVKYVYTKFGKMVETKHIGLGVSLHFTDNRAPEEIRNRLLGSVSVLDEQGIVLQGFELSVEEGLTFRRAYDKLKTSLLERMGIQVVEVPDEELPSEEDES